MKQLVVIIILGLFLLAVIGLILRKTILKAPPAGLQVNSTPVSTVFLDGKNMGQTPFEDKNLSPGEVTLRLVPESATGNLFPWETKIKLVSGTQAIVNREFGESEAASAGEVMSLEKISDKKTASLAIISSPDSSLVKINGESKGFTPLSLEKLQPEERELAVSASGFLERKMKIKLLPGFKLILNVKLAEEREGEPQAGATPTPTGAELERPYVEIKNTPTGWLRVRMEPSTSATEAAKVKPGEQYPLLEEKSGWYKIKYESAKEGWIAGQYAEKFE